MNNELTYTELLIKRASATYHTLLQEPQIVPDFASADLPTMTVVIYCTMWLGVSNPDTLFTYLVRRNSSLGRDVFDFILDAFEGTDHRHNLWTRDKFGDYQPLLSSLSYSEGNAYRPAPPRPMASRGLSAQN